MADKKISELNAAASIDSINDMLPIVQVNTTNRINRDTLLGITSQPVGTTEAQTLTNKTIALGSNTVSGTVAQFNAAVSDGDFATLAGTETLTNKTLTSPTINSPILTSATTNTLTVTGTLTMPNATVTTAKQKALSWCVNETDAISLTTSWATVASQVLPAVTQAHTYMVSCAFAVNHLGATTFPAYDYGIFEGANQIQTTYSEKISGSYITDIVPLFWTFTSSATGGQTINFKIKKVAGGGGQSHWSGKFTIVDLGCA